MTSTPDAPDAARSSRSTVDEAVNEVRMSFGDHLDELRTRLVRALAGFVLCTIVTLIFARDILDFLFQPVLVVQWGHGLRPELQSLSVQAGFLAFLKIGFLSGLIVAMPWVLYQLWQFISAGLYKQEQRFVRLFAPATGVLFFLGVAFLYYIVLPIVLLFFVKFNAAFDLPDLRPTTFQKMLLDVEEPEVAADAAEAPLLSLPILDKDPAEPHVGDTWINRKERTLMCQTSSGLLYAPLEMWEHRSSVHSQFALDFYISFVLLLALAFGLAFELPVAVFFLALTGIVSTDAMAAGRKYVLLGIVIAAAILTPPDVVSQLLLAAPMYLLFEIGLRVARIVERRNARQEAQA